MRIYHTHPDTGLLLGIISDADESPLEPGVYLIPSHSTPVEPPADVAGSTRHFMAGRWEYRALPVQPEPESVSSIDDLRAAAVTQIKHGASQIILSRYPDWKQRNMTARAVQLLAAGTASGAEWDALSAVWAWISAVRQESDRVEASILSADTQIDIDAALASATWPA